MIFKKYIRIYKQVLYSTKSIARNKEISFFVIRSMIYKKIKISKRDGNSLHCMIVLTNHELH